MRDNHIKRLVVTHENKIIGIIAEMDIIAIAPSLFHLVEDKGIIEGEIQ